MLCWSIRVFAKLKPCDGTIVNFIGTVCKTQGADARIVLGETRFVGHAGGAERLNRIVDDAQRHVGRRHLNHRDFKLRDQALAAFQKAVQVDPGFADA